jgi:phospholipid/cholesterol/gamma-HCH transport system permease protein
MPPASPHASSALLGELPRMSRETARRMVCMPAVDPQPHTGDWHVEGSQAGVRLSGHLLTRDAAPILAAVREATTGARKVEVDLGGVEQIDGSVIALVRADLAARGVGVNLLGGDRFRPLIALYADGTTAPEPRKRRTPERLLAHVGRATVQDVSAVGDFLKFGGEMTVAVGRLVRHPRRSYWKEIAPLIERAGPDAMPIVLTINFLLGLVIAYMSARELKMFAANAYVADLIAIAMTRQLGPLMTAIIVSGRSGAAFATELGSMKVSDEVDALRTLGLEPFGWLVLPRVITLVLVLPFLTILADVIGILGGLVIAVTSLELTPQQYFKQVSNSLASFDVWFGLLLSVAFAIAIGLISCHQGFAASGGPQGVGRRTTSTVVTSLFAIVVIDAVITVLFQLLGIG